MVVVALAGATSGFGLTMLRVFLHQNEHRSHPHQIVLLSRTAQPKFTAQGVDVRPVDYNDHPQLVKALSGVHTVLSTIGGSLAAIQHAQLRLLEAAKEAGVKRFAPSEYAGNGYEGIDLYASKAVVWNAVQKCGMEYARFSCGLFMSALATGTPKPVTEVGKDEGAQSGEEEALAGMRPWNFVINMKAGTVDYPGDGSAELVWTDMRDVSRFVFRALDLPRWNEDLGMRGDVKSFREVVAIVEKVQQRKFLVKENSIESMLKSAEDLGLQFYNQVRVAIAKGWCMVPGDLNREFPETKPTTCEEFVDKWWAGVELGEPRWEADRAFGADDM